MARSVLLLAVLVALLAFQGILAQSNPTQWSCRMDPEVGNQYCGLPQELANFQGFFECDNRVKIGRPRSIAELQALLPLFRKAKAVGVGGSFNKCVV